MDEFDEIKRKKFNISVWMISTAVIFLLLIISIFTHGFGIKAITGATTSNIEDSVKEYIENNLVATGTKVEVSNLVEENGLYKVTLNIANQEFDSYVTKDGKLLFPTVIDMSKEVEAVQQTANVEIPKKDVAEADLFIMSYCPYGTQAQSAILPVMELLKDKVKINIRFVYYIMHGKQEIDENTRQYCIQKEQNDKLTTYLKCFLDSKNYANCLKTAKVDETKLNKCVQDADKQFSITKNFDDKTSWLSGKYPLYNVDKTLNDKYKVQGSPTLIINGVEYSGGRTSEEFKKAICSGFNKAPSECGEVIESTTASTTTTGSCG